MRTENTNIKQNINTLTYLDHAAKDTEMLWYPDWKPITLNKWLGEDFNKYNCTYTGKRKFEDSWKVFPIRIGHPDSYEDGLEAVG